MPCCSSTCARQEQCALSRSRPRMLHQPHQAQNPLLLAWPEHQVALALLQQQVEAVCEAVLWGAVQAEQ